MKGIILAMIIAAGTWGVRIIDDYSAVVVNNYDEIITCYIYYEDGDFLKRRVKPHTESEPFPRYLLAEVECY